MKSKPKKAAFMSAKLLWGTRMKTVAHGVTALLRNSFVESGRGCKDRDFQRICRLPKNQNGVYLKWKSRALPQRPEWGRRGFQMTGAYCMVLCGDFALFSLTSRSAFVFLEVSNNHIRFLPSTHRYSCYIYLSKTNLTFICSSSKMNRSPFLFLNGQFAPKTCCQS